MKCLLLTATATHENPGTVRDVCLQDRQDSRAHGHQIRSDTRSWVVVFDDRERVFECQLGRHPKGRTSGIPVRVSVLQVEGHWLKGLA